MAAYPGGAALSGISRILFFVSRIDVHHHMLDGGILPFNAFMDPLRNRMGVDQGHISVYRDLQLNIDPAAELAGMQQVDPLLFPDPSCR